MSKCKRCERNGDQQEGGVLGLCDRHKRTKCLVCRKLSGGAELCSTCTHEEELLRWKCEANLRVIDPDAQQVYLELRKERLLEAKFHAHRAVEILFRGILLSIEAVWGDIKKPDEIERKKAA